MAAVVVAAVVVVVVVVVVFFVGTKRLVVAAAVVVVVVAWGSFHSGRQRTIGEEGMKCYPIYRHSLLLWGERVGRLPG